MLPMLTHTRMRLAVLCRYLSLMERCWAEDEHARPTFEEVLSELDDLRNCELGAARLAKNSDSTRCVLPCGGRMLWAALICRACV